MPSRLDRQVGGKPRPEARRQGVRILLEHMKKKLLAKKFNGKKKFMQHASYLPVVISSDGPADKKY